MPKNKPLIDLGTFEFNPKNKEDVKKLARFIGALKTGDEYARPLKKMTRSEKFSFSSGAKHG